MAISMTGFGRGEYKDDNYQFLVECKTINHKYADINIRLPRKLSFLEDKARILVKDYIKRGRVDLYIKLDLLGSEDVNLKFDEALATQYVSILKQIKGKKLAEDIQNRCDLLKNYIEDIEKYSYNVVIDYKEKLKNRISDMLEDPSIIDESRLAQEVAIYADKSSITEEIVRFKSHIEQLKNTVVKNESIGRKIDFLIQEMNRETNTIGSKSSDLNITNLVVEVKSELEKIREQIQNIE